MKRFWRIVSIALICGALASPQVDARGRSGNNNSRSTTSRTSNSPRSGSSRSNAPRQSNNNAPKPSNNNNSRPGGNNNAPKPGGNNSRPSNNASRPGGNNNAPKPGGNNHNASRPNNHNNHAPNHGAPNHHAPKPNHHAPHHSPVHRPHCPPPRPYHRPVPPPSFRPYHGCPTFSTIFGITLGTTINLSLDYLARNSYNVYGYGDDVIYLRNVNQYGYSWPDATLYYESNRLVGTQLIYSTSYYDHGRYNNVYHSLTNQYGNPVSVQNSSNGMTATWWGYDGQYITLDFRPSYTSNGQLRYFTTLSFGM